MCRVGDTPVVNVPVMVNVNVSGKENIVTEVVETVNNVESNVSKDTETLPLLSSPTSTIRRSQRIQNEHHRRVKSDPSTLSSLLIDIVNEWFPQRHQMLMMTTTQLPVNDSDINTSSIPSLSSTLTTPSVNSLSSIERNAVINFVQQLNVKRCVVSTWMWYFVVAVTQWTENVSDPTGLCRVLTQLGTHLENVFPLDMLLTPPHVVLTLAECHWQLTQQSNASSHHLSTAQRLVTLLASLPLSHPLHSSPLLTLRYVPPPSLVSKTLSHSRLLLSTEKLFDCRLNWLYAHILERQGSGMESVIDCLKLCLKMFEENKVSSVVALPLTPSLGPITQEIVQEKMRTVHYHSVQQRLEEAWRSQLFNDVVKEHSTLLTTLTTLWHSSSRSESPHHYSTLINLFLILGQVRLLLLLLLSLSPCDLFVQDSNVCCCCCYCCSEL